MNLKGKKIAVLGLGDEGIVWVAALASAGVRVYGLGSATPAQAKKIQTALSKVKCRLHFKKIPTGALSSFDYVIHTPGGGQFKEAREAARAAEIPVFSDLDFALAFMKGNLIGVTGTNGKSTTSLLIHQMLEKQGKSVALAGGDYTKWGVFLSRKHSFSDYVMELSSRRLENSQKIHPHIAVLLNLFPAHGERHAGGFPEYLAAKARVFKNQTAEDYLVYEASAGNIRELLKRENPPAKRVRFALSGPLDPPSAYIRNQKEIVWQSEAGRVETYSLEKVLKVPTFLLNLLAAICVARLSGVEPKAILQVMENFQGLPSRMEKVRIAGEVTYIDDSRATNVGATAWALSSVNRPIIWLAGGRVDEAAQLRDLERLAKGKVKLMILMGSGKEKLARVWKKVAPVVLAKSLKAAVDTAQQNAEPQDVVLFSPACLSDPYTQGKRKERGEEFKKLVLRLKDLPRVIKHKPSVIRI